MYNIDYKIAKELKEKLLCETELIDFKVFGSRASEKSTEYSDMDVFIEVNALNKNIKNKIHDIVWDVGFNNFIVISPLICSRYDIEQTALKSSPIIQNIMLEGVNV